LEYGDTRKKWRLGRELGGLDPGRATTPDRPVTPWRQDVQSEEGFPKMLHSVGNRIVASGCA